MADGSRVSSVAGIVSVSLMFPFAETFSVTAPTEAFRTLVKLVKLWLSEIAKKKKRRRQASALVFFFLNSENVAYGKKKVFMSHFISAYFAFIVLL